ncbi:unnamed protein product [Rotaria sordida]|uniref:Uncharacterized protein n=1 Tax=Rotaria sordida TaxID=392033 RepID=A0A815JXM3_9BILA|nr:unnamed protein product [Rotaria sordida]CAF1383727.1 unnamed protein product [Rotaria sordida]CAF1536106.1 unnamed protein product [Rotaria sordida]CAF3775195.1 unnamed protein product [Rotaria sordida]
MDSSSLYCPCSTITISYDRLISISPVYHQICSGQFVTIPWFSATWGDVLSGYIYPSNDFRLASQPQFVLINTLCQMSIQTVNDNWQLFVERQFVTSNALSPQLFQTEANSLLHQFQTQTQVIVFQALQLIRTITHVDRLIAVLRVNSNTIKLWNPSQNNYEQLQIQYSDTLQYPCSQIGITYGSFISIKPIFHQVCSSSFTSDEWLIGFMGNITAYDPHDYRSVALSHSQFLRSLCSTAYSTCMTAVSTFNDNIFVSAYVVPIKQIYLEVSSIIQQFQLLIPKTFLHTLELIRYLNHGNGIQSVLQTNWRFIITNDS